MAAVAHANRLHRIVAYVAAGAWVVLGTYSIRQLANQLGRAIAIADKATAGSVRLIFTIIGLIFVVLVALTILRIGVSQLLLGGAITGVVLGVAAQQSLGNVFAGIVLLMARPFRAGDLVRLRTGSLGGPLEGHVVSMGLVYVVFTTEEGTTLIPNLTLLASGIVRSPRPQPPAVAPTVAASADSVTASDPPTPAASGSAAPTAPAVAGSATPTASPGAADPAGARPSSEP
jgi:small-conductance mechanosensitive channel